MLAEDEKSRIRSEEIYRAEIRRELEASRDDNRRVAKLWSLLNSSFVLWLLSSVVLSGIAAAFGSCEARRSEQLRKNRIEQHIDLELGRRIDLALAGLEVSEANIDSATWEPERAYALVVDYLNNQIRNRDYSVFPEYRYRTFPSLIVELSAVIEPVEREQLSIALKTFERLEYLGSRSTQSSPEERRNQRLDLLGAAKDSIEKRLIRPSWQHPLTSP